MLPGMYLWCVLGNDVGAKPGGHGACRTAASALREGEQRVADGSAFLCIVEQVVRRLSVGELETTYQGTGRYYIGRRTRSGGVHWQAMTRRVDPAEVYRITDIPSWIAGQFANRGGQRPAG
jgi:hypothetical protein